jgi:hypothetical protein
MFAALPTGLTGSFRIVGKITTRLLTTLAPGLARAFRIVGEIAA